MTDLASSLRRLAERIEAADETATASDALRVLGYLSDLGPGLTGRRDQPPVALLSV